MGDTQYDNAASQETQPLLSYYTATYDATWGAVASTKGGPVCPMSNPGIRTLRSEGPRVPPFGDLRPGDGL
jgi:hypothetical protein